MYSGGIVVFSIVVHLNDKLNTSFKSTKHIDVIEYNNTVMQLTIIKYVYNIFGKFTIIIFQI